MWDERDTWPEGIVVLRATAEDADAIAAIHDDTMRWAFAQGFRRAHPLDLATLRADALRRIAEHEVYVAAGVDGAAVATLTLTWEDDGLWSDVPGSACYLYAFAVKRGVAGQGVGRAMLRWAEGYVAAMGRSFLRLECDAGNPGLRAYYERAGFTHRGDAQRGSRALARYERGVRVDSVESPHGTLTIALAQPEDLDAILAIGDDVDAWLLGRGIIPGTPPRPMREIVADRTARGVQYLARAQGVPAGNIVLEWEDDGAWTDLPGDACYVHGFAVSRAYAGIGVPMLRWAEGLAAERGKTLLRLDCAAENADLRAYYARAGFTHRGDVVMPHHNAARFERRIEAGGAGA